MSNFGNFANDGAEYVFTTPETPRPMLNYIWNSSILSGINQTGGGNGAYGDRAACYIDPNGKGRSVIIKNGNRYFYVRDEETGEYWNPGWYPVKKELDHYECTHGLGYSTIEGSSNHVNIKARVFINAEDPTEIWTLTATNNSNQTKKIKLYSFAEFTLTGYKVYCNYYSNLQAIYNADNNLIVAFNTAQERTHEWYNGFMASSLAPTGFDTSRKSFIGMYGDITEPRVVVKGKCDNSLATCEDMVGVIENTLVLEPGQSVSYNVLIGATNSTEEAIKVTKKLFSDHIIEEQFQELIVSKVNMIHDIEINTPDSKINNLTNKWLKQQVQLCAEVGRDTGKGFRDQLQDAWAIASFNPAMAKDKILETLRYQYSDGRCVRGWLPLDHHIYSDGPVWIAPTINAFLKETGDYDFLNIKVPYLDEGDATVWEHILLSVRYSSDDTGERNLVLAHAGDWNDSLNGIGVGGKGESVWTSIALYYALDNVAEMASGVFKDVQLQEEMLNRAARIKKAINDTGWDGEWYLAGYTDAGAKVGSQESKEGSIYLNSQTWAIMAGVAEDDRLEKCLKALDDKLDSPYGPLTLYPTYTKYNAEIGRLTGFVPGIWENGTPYCHGGTFKIVADCCAGRGDAAYDTVMKIMPDSESNPSSYSGCEPYALTNMYFGPDNPRAGQTMFAWVTGTAGWMFRGITQYMLGFYPSYDSIEIKPCVPSHWKECTLRRKFRGDRYILHIVNNGMGNKVINLYVDQQKIEGTQFKTFNDGKEHIVHVELN
jgi:cellobiose phosphorylase